MPETFYHDLDTRGRGGAVYSLLYCPKGLSYKCFDTGRVLCQVQGRRLTHTADIANEMGIQI